VWRKLLPIHTKRVTFVIGEDRKVVEVIRGEIQFEPARRRGAAHPERTPGGRVTPGLETDLLRRASPARGA